MQNILFNKFINFIVFQTGWIILVYWHNNTVAIIGLVLALLNYTLCYRAKHQALLAGFCIAMLGAASDYLLLHFNFISFPGQDYVLLPSWLLVLWLLFVSTFASSLAWIKKSKILSQALIGGLGGAFSYIAGAKLGAMQIGFSTSVQFAIHFGVWFFMFPALYYLYAKLTSKLR